MEIIEKEGLLGIISKNFDGKMMATRILEILKEADIHCFSNFLVYLCLQVIILVKFVIFSFFQILLCVKCELKKKILLFDAKNQGLS